MKAIVIGSSAGGLNALKSILAGIVMVPRIPFFAVQHSAHSGEHLLAGILQKSSRMKVAEAEDKMEIQPGHFYIAPANYHMLIESRSSLALSTDAKVNYSRPSIDVLFESAARIYREDLTAIILTGANSDGAQGIVTIAGNGGLTIAQDPSDAEFPYMPQAAINTGKVDLILPIEGIIEKITTLIQPEKKV